MNLLTLRTYSSFVKLEHTLFALPLIVAGALLGHEFARALAGNPGLTVGKLVLILLAGAGARTFALSMNRIIDRRLDAANPRTAGRELPSGRMGLREAWGVASVGLVVYLVAAALLPGICLALSPVPVAVFVAYPFLKRFTALCHFGVGLGLALSPLGGYVGVTGTLAGSGGALALAGFTLFWVAGFDVIYATLDEAHDRSHGVRSLPARVGKRSALRISAILHAVAFGFLAGWCLAETPGLVAWGLLAAIGGLLIWEQRAAEQVELAFFHINSGLGFVVLALVWAGLSGDLGWTTSP